MSNEPQLVDDDGNQIVAVGRYAYVWKGSPPLKVGDVVRLPGNWTTGFEPFCDTVTGLGTYYEGPLSPVIDRA